MVKGWMRLGLGLGVFASSGLGLLACGPTESVSAEDTQASVEQTLVAPARRVLVDATTPAYYNDKLGTLLDGSMTIDGRVQLFPSSPSNVSIRDASEPNLSKASSRLGDWISSVPHFNFDWRYISTVPTTWPRYTETAIVYGINVGPAGMKDVRASLGIDNGIFVWLDGVYKFGAVEPGGAFKDEYTVQLGDLSPGRHYLQILREDNGGDTGYYIEVTGVPNEAPARCENNTGHFTSTGSTASLHLQHTATVLQDGKVLVTGSYHRTPEVYNPATGTWSTTGASRSTHRRHTATLLNDGRVLVAGGDGAKENASVEVYNPATGTWSATGNLLTYRREHTAVRLQDGRVLVMGGTGKAGDILTSAEVYNPATGTWSPAGNMAQKRRSFTATLLADGRVLVAGGLVNRGDECRGTNCLASAEVYNPATGTWSSTDAMAYARGFHAAALLKDGRVLVSGGVMDGQQSTSAEVYDPATGKWSVTSAMRSPRRRHALTVLPNGLVLVTGGYDAMTGIQSSAELYAPATGTWCVTGNMTQGRYEHTATLLNNGRVLITAGFSKSSQHTAEVFNPGS